MRDKKSSLVEYLEQVAIRLLAICYRWPKHIPLIKGIIREFPTPSTRAVAGALVSSLDADGLLDVAQFIVLTTQESPLVKEITEIADGADMAAHDNDPTMVMMYLRHLTDGAEQARLARTLYALAETADQKQVDLDNLRSRALTAVQSAKSRDGERDLRDLLSACFDEVASWQQGDPDTDIYSGLAELDGILRFPKGNLIVFGALSGGGKTIFGVQMAVENAIRFKKLAQDDPAAHEKARVLYISAEMTAVEIMHRMAGYVCGITEEHLRRSGSQRDFDTYNAALDYVAQLPIIIDDTVGPTTEYVHARVGQVATMFDLRFVVFDHTEKAFVGNMPCEDVQTVSIAIASFKNTAKAYNTCFLALHQFNRAMAMRDDKRPQITDLRGSGRIEHEAYGVILLHSELALVQHANTPMPRKLSDGSYAVTMVVAKHRNGRTGDAKQTIMPDRVSFGGLPRQATAHATPAQTPRQLALTRLHNADPGDADAAYIHEQWEE